MPTNMEYDDIYKNRWIKADDIGDEDLILTIKDVNAEEVGADKEMKLVLTFKDQEKGLALNKTNAENLKDRFGATPNDWIGKKIALYTTEVDYAGKTTLAVRIRKKTPAPAPKPATEDNY